MESKYFLHRIQEEDGAFQKGIEVHDTLDAAIRAFWGRMKNAYNNPSKLGMTYVSCKITDVSGSVVGDYNQTWIKSGSENNIIFMHYIRLEGETFRKDIDICADYDTARRAYADCMEYGYNNPNHANVSFVSCEITDQSGFRLMAETWVKPEPEPEPEN